MLQNGVMLKYLAHGINTLFKQRRDELAQQRWEIKAEKWLIRNLILERLRYTVVMLVSVNLFLSMQKKTNAFECIHETHPMTRLPCVKASEFTQKLFPHDTKQQLLVMISNSEDMWYTPSTVKRYQRFSSFPQTLNRSCINEEHYSLVEWALNYKFASNATL